MKLETLPEPHGLLDDLAAHRTLLHVDCRLVPARLGSVVQLLSLPHFGLECIVISVS